MPEISTDLASDSSGDDHERSLIAQTSQSGMARCAAADPVLRQRLYPARFRLHSLR